VPLGRRTAFSASCGQRRRAGSAALDARALRVVWGTGDAVAISTQMERRGSRVQAVQDVERGFARIGVGTDRICIGRVLMAWGRQDGEQGTQNRPDRTRDSGTPAMGGPERRDPRVRVGQDNSAPSGFRLGRIFGIPIYVHPSWLIIFLLITITLGKQFATQHPNWSQQQNWALGIITSILFFASVVFHELSHSVVAKLYRISVESITLFVFGGLARIARDPSSAIQEFNIAIAGPLSSMFLAACFWLVARAVPNHQLIFAACTWLWEINLMLALFNLVPGFPLDGGRILRGIAWGITKNFDRATKIASGAGRFFAYLLIFSGVWQAFNGYWVNGVWIAFIGWFLLSAARESYVQVELRNTLTGVRAADIMTQDIPTVERNISIDDYVHEVMRTGRRFHIVTGAGKPVGLVTLHSARSVPREEWANTSIQPVMMPFDRIHAASPDEPALGVLQRMQSEDINQMPVISDGRIVGMIARDTILRVLQTRLQLGHLAS
jgi:Zn-dependent protease/predicted transcriptional regulator